MIKGAIENGVKIVCLSELFTNGFDFQYIKKWTRAIPKKIIIELSKKKLRTFIISASSQIIDDGKLYNTFF